jgi:hypothetical protein
MFLTGNYHFLKKIRFLKLDYLLIFVMMMVYYGYRQWNYFIGDPDGFYHAKIALFLKQGIVLKTLPWMQFTSLKDHFVDHHFLYHLLLVPFISFFPSPLWGVKIATVVFTALMIVTFYWLLKKLKLSWPLIFTLLFISLEGLNFRLYLIKVNSLSLLLIWLLIYALFKEKRWLMFSLGFIFVWLYGGWPLAILISLLYFLSQKIFVALQTTRLKIFWHKTIHFFHEPKKTNHNLKLLASLILGLLAGLIINPYWPANLYFYYQQIFQIGIINFGNKFPVGGEWYGTNLPTIISSFPHVFILACLAILLLFFNYKKISQLTWFSFLLSFIFLLLTIKSRRYIEYFSPFTLFFIATAFTDLKKIISWKIILNFWNKNNHFIKIYLGLNFCLFLTLIIPTIIHKIWDFRTPQSWPLDKFSLASQWLKQNTPPQSIIFHDDWDIWPLLFYNNDQNYYIVGLDSTFMYNYNPTRHRLFINITTGQEKNQVAEKIKTNFGANFVFIEKKGHQDFINNLILDHQAKSVYEDGEVKIFALP